MTGLAQQQCSPCNEATTPLTEEEVKQLWLETPMWKAHDVDGVKHIHRAFEFPSYAEGITFVNEIAHLAESANHHPKMIVDYRTIEVEWYTHTIKGLHRNDFIMAAKSDKAYLDTLDAGRARSVVGEASEESFPASDPPGWIGTTQEEVKEESGGNASPSA